MTDEARCFKKIGGPNLGSVGLNQTQNEVFRHLFESGSYVFLEVAYNDSFRQCLTSSSGKIQEKKIGTQIWAEQAKIGPDFRFFAIFSCLVR